MLFNCCLLRICCLVTAVVFLFVPWSLSRNGSVRHSIFFNLYPLAVASSFVNNLIYSFWCCSKHSSIPYVLLHYITIIIPLHFLQDGSFNNKASAIHTSLLFYTFVHLFYILLFHQYLLYSLYLKILLVVLNFRFEVLTAMTMKNPVLWNIMPCSQVKVNLCFGGAYSLSL
jgi:hypothetical protein